MNSGQMAAPSPMPLNISGPAGVLPATPTEGSSSGAQQALVPLAKEETEEEQRGGFSAAVSLLTVELDVSVPVRSFRVRNLLALEPGQLIESQWGHAEDVPLATADVQLAWSEFEVVETQMAVRITRLA